MRLYLLPAMAFLTLAGPASTCRADGTIYSWIDGNGTQVFSNISSISPDAHMLPLSGFVLPSSAAELPDGQQDFRLASDAGADAGLALLGKEQHAQEHDALQDH